MASSEVSIKGNRGGDNFSSSGYSDPKDTRNVPVAGDGQNSHSNRPVAAERVGKSPFLSFLSFVLVTDLVDLIPGFNLFFFFFIVDPEAALYKELWHACAGPLVTVPRQDDRVFYFPQGHIEQVRFHLLRSSLPFC